jgi:hypothetical protein
MYFPALPVSEVGVIILADCCRGGGGILNNTAKSAAISFLRELTALQSHLRLRIGLKPT